MLRDCHCIYKTAKKYNPDLFFIVSSPPFLGYLTKKLRKKSSKIIFKLQDVFPDSLIHANKAKESSLLIKFLRKKEKQVYKNVDLIISCSDDVKKTLVSRSVEPSMISVVYDWVDENKLVPISRQDNWLFKKYNIPLNTFVVCYAGNIGYLQDVKTMLLAANELRDFDIIFVIIGNGAQEDSIRDLIVNLKLENVRMFPSEPIENVSYVYSLGDIGLVLLNENITKYAFPSKTWSILSAGRMILCEADNNSQLSKIINESISGETFSYGDYHSLASLIKFYFANQKNCFEKGMNGRKFIVSSMCKSRAIQDINNAIVELTANNLIEKPTI